MATHKSKVCFTREDVLKIIKNTINFPYPQICKHLVAANLLSMLEERGEPPTESFERLAKAVVRAYDDEALLILEEEFGISDAKIP